MGSVAWRWVRLLIVLPGMTAGCVRPVVEAEYPRAVFLVTIDTLRADHLGCYGYPRAVTPFLDSLAAQSVLFEQHIVSSSHTGPSHSSLFTSLYPAQHRVLTNGMTLDPAITTLAEAMVSAGFRTAGFPAAGFLQGLQQGFEHYDCRSGYQPARQQFSKALSWLADAKSGDRVFLWIHLFDVHQWYTDAHAESEVMSEISDLAGPNGAELEQFLVDRHGLDLENFPGKLTALEVMDRYDAQLLSVDRALRRFYDAVGELGWFEKSLWVVTSDHGEGLGNHQFIGHGKNLYSEQLRVPLLIHAVDGRYPAGRVPGLTRQVDVAPTLAEISGAVLPAVPMPPQGGSMLAVLQNPDSGFESAEAFLQRRPADQNRLDQGWVSGELFAVQTSKEKLIFSTDGPCERYDLSRDPFEENDTLDRPCAEDPLFRPFFDRFRTFEDEGRSIEGSIIDPDHIEELKALGYL